eukprot:m.18465 g.18465  ORF g.18465 m.18465 type:complete len:51 (-) comp6313_c0_seq2:216-368(-)
MWCLTCGLREEENICCHCSLSPFILQCLVTLCFALSSGVLPRYSTRTVAC